MRRLSRVCLRPLLLSSLFLFSLTCELIAQDRQILFECGASTGQSYFLEGLLSTERSKKFESDGISNGRILLVSEGGEFDLEIADAIGATPRSFRSEGTEVFPINQEGRRISIAAVGQGFIEIYTFDPQDKLVFYSAHKIGTIIPKVGLYYAKCK